jgi:hypothetical protein
MKPFQQQTRSNTMHTKSDARRPGRKPGDEKALNGQLSRKQVLVDEDARSVLTQIGGGELSLGIREAARRLALSGQTQPFVLERS